MLDNQYITKFSSQDNFT